MGVGGSSGAGTVAGSSGSAGVPGSGSAGVIGSSGTAGVGGSSGVGTSSRMRKRYPIRAGATRARAEGDLDRAPGL